MRLYVKLVLMAALFAGLASAMGRRMTSELAYEARVAFVCAFGTEADYAALVDDTERILAAQNGGADLYWAGQRFRQLVADHVADAARRNVPLTDDELVRIQSECAREAFASPRRRGVSIGTNPPPSITE